MLGINIYSWLLYLNSAMGGCGFFSEVGTEMIH